MTSKGRVVFIKVFYSLSEFDLRRSWRKGSTTITFTGAYRYQSPAAIQLDFGFNKDHRPDYKQIVFGLNITDDRHVPISYQLFNGNQADVNTHIPNWDSLCNFLANEDFFYIADSKLCSEDNMYHIDKNGGKVITIMPKNRKEVSAFYERLRHGEEIEWQPAYSKEHSRKKGQMITYQTYSEERSWEGYYNLGTFQQQGKTRLQHSNKTDF